MIKQNKLKPELIDEIRWKSWFDFITDLIIQWLLLFTIIIKLIGLIPREHKVDL